MSLTADARQTQRVSISAYIDEQSRTKHEPPPESPRSASGSASTSEPQPSRDVDEVRRLRLGQQRKHMRALAWLRHVTLPDLGVDLDSSRDGEELGMELELTTDEYLHLRTMLGRFPAFLPAELTKDQAKTLRDDFNRPGRTAAKAKQRAAAAAEKASRAQSAADLDCRSSAIWTVLTYPRFQSVAEIMKVVAKTASFRTADGNGVLAGQSLRVTILRELKKPELADRVEVKLERTRNGLPVHLFRRQKPS
jgi:hypothetical protein